MKYLASIFAIIIAATAYGQNIEEVLRSIPLTGEIIPCLTKENVSQLSSDTTQVIIPCALGNFEIAARDKNSITVKTSNAGTIQIKLLPLINNSKIVCVVNSVCAKVCDSNIRFYDTGWNLLPRQPLLPKISAALFIDKNKSGEEYERVLSALSINPISFSFEKGSDNLEVKLNYKNYMPEEIIREISPFIRQDSITLHWNNTSFQQ